MPRLPLWALIAALTACTQPQPATQGDDAPPQGANVMAACPDKADRLPGSALCPTDAAALLRADAGERPAPPGGCQWRVAETALPDGAYLLYRAARCAGKSMTLAYAAGTPLARLVYAFSPLFGADARGQTLVTFAPADPRDPQASILALARAAITDPAEAAGCHVRKADIPGWPTDALVVDIADADAAMLPQDEVRSACGPLGLDQDSQLYWRTAQGIAWHFDLGQEAAEIDPASLTVVRKDAREHWAPLP